MLSKLRSIGVLLSGAAGAGVLAAAAPMALSYADDCAAGECSLVSGGDATDLAYSGFRPMFTDWKGVLPVDVQVTPEDGSSFVSGSYNVTFDDYKTQGYDQTTYQYGNFTPTADNTAGTDSDDLTGVTVYDTTYGQLNTLVIKYPDGNYYEVITTPSYVSTIEAGPAGSADYIQYAGQSTPTELWNGLPDNSFPTVPDVMPPDPWFLGDVP